MAWPSLLPAQRLSQATVPGGGGFSVVHESWTVADGLPVNAINDLLQSRDGYIWAATFDGLVRFDGVRFTTFNTANSPGLPSDRIVELRQGVKGDIWLFTEQRSVVRLRAGRFTTVAAQLLMTADGDGSIPNPPFIVNSILEDRSGVLWVGGGVLPDGLYRCQREPIWRCTGERAGGTGFDDVRAMHEDSDGRLWVGSRRGLFRRDASGWVRLDTIASAPHPTVRAFAASRDGAIRMGTDGGGVARYRDGRFTSITARDGLPGDVIRPLCTTTPMAGSGSARRAAAWHVSILAHGPRAHRWRGVASAASHRATDCSTTSSTRSWRMMRHASG